MKWKQFFYAVLAGILAVFIVFLGIALDQYYGQKLLNRKKI